MSNYKMETKCVQSGYNPGNGEPRVLPIIQSTTFRYTSSDQMGRLFDLEESGYFYTRLQNPTNESDELMNSWAGSGDLFSTACEGVPDKQGRSLLPAELRAYAGLEKDVTIIGNRNHAEIWATEVWNARRAAVTNDQRAEQLRKLHL